MVNYWIENLLHFPCIFKMITRLYCPVCGGTRAMLAFLQFHFVESFLDNPIFLYLVLMTGWLILGWILRKVGKVKEDAMRFQLWMLYVGLAILVVFFIGRNIGVYVFQYDYLGDIL